MDSQHSQSWDLRTLPTAQLLDLLHDYHAAHSECADNGWKDDRRAHYATHFFNLRWSVARELERRGFDAVAALQTNPKTYQAAQEIAKGGFISYPTTWLIQKAVTLKSNERWITVHPHGEDEPGVPVLVREHEDGSASIIGGAGGGLNYVRLTKLKSPEEYKASQKEKATARRQEEKQRREQLTPEQKELERTKKTALEQQQKQKETETIQKVYQALGLKKPEIKSVDQIVSETGVDEASAKIARSNEIRQHLAYVSLVTKATQEAVMADQELAAQAGLGDVTLAKTSDTGLWSGKGPVGMALLTQEKPDEGSGISTDFAKRAAEQGASKEAIKEESKLVRERAHQKQGEEAEAASHAIAERTKRWASEVKTLKQAGVIGKDVPEEVKLPDADKIMDVLRASKELENVRRAVAKETGKLKKEGGDAKPFVIETSEDVDSQVVKDLADEVQVRAARALLGQVEKQEGLTRHIRAGAFDVLNEAGLTVGGEELLSRDMVDFLGSAGAARLMAQKLRAGLDEAEFGNVAEAVASLHSRTNAEIAEKAVAEANEHLKAAKEIELSTVENPVDLATARALNDKRAEHADAARRILGDAYGRTAALGELSLALKTARKTPGELTIDLGDTSRESAITMARAFGLIPHTGDVEEGSDERDYVAKEKIGGSETGGDYILESAGGKTVLRLQPSALDKLGGEVSPGELKAYQEAQAIKNGSLDEEGWLPAGIERRPSSTFQDPTFELGRFDTTLQLGDTSQPQELREKLADFIGAHIAEGMELDDLRASIYSPEFKTTRIPEHLHGHFDKARDEFLPFARLTDEERAKYQAAKDLPDADRRALAKERLKILQDRTEELRQQTEEKARVFSAAYKKKRGMTDEQLVELHTQPLQIDAERTPEAIHRTLTALPNGAVAFKAMGDLNNRDRTTLREHYLKNIAGLDLEKEREEQAQARQEKAQADEPVAQQMNIFGELEDVTRAQALGEQPAGEQKAEPSRTSKAWEGYVKAMGSEQAAYETLQADLRGHVAKEYAKNHGHVFGRPLKVGTERLPNWEGHLIGRLPEEKLRAALGAKYEEASRLMARIARRGPGGKFAAEESSRKEAADQLMAMMKEHQLGLFEHEEAPSLERPTIGRDAEKKLASVWNKAAERFDPKASPVSLIPDLSMSGDKVKQQRAVRLAVQNRRMGLHFGAGSGKSLISIGAFTQLHDEGKAHKAVYAVPSAVLSQFGSEMMRFTQPGKYRWLADPSASREERFAAYADPDTHMVVATHQAFRDDLMHAIAKSREMAPDKVADWFHGHDETAQRAIIKQAVKDAGWKVDFFAVDEAQGILNRAGKPDSSMARTLDGFSYHMPSYLSMTGTPVKNDASEGFDVLKKLDPARFTDRDAFMRRYGANTPAGKRSLQRLMARYVYTDRIPSGVNRYTDVRTMPLTPKQQQAYDAVEQALAKVRTSRRGGAVDIGAAKTLAPQAFEGKPESEHQTIANELAKTGLGGRVEHRRAAIVNQFDFDHNAKVHALRGDLTADKDKPHVIFAHNYGSVDHIQRVCKELGLKAGVVSGDQSAKDKAKVRNAFQAGELNVIINTDAGSTGQNLQRGSVLINYDTPDTAMTHEQRIARIDRLGQQNDVTVRDYVTDTAYERRARRRLERKQALADVFQSPSDNLDDSGLAAEIQAVRATKRNQRKAA
jgi:hypothetical protein